MSDASSSTRWAVNPKYYEKMSELLDALIAQRKQEALDYKAYLARIIDLTTKVTKPDTKDYPIALNTAARRALYDNLKGIAGLEERLAGRRAVAESNGNAPERAALAVDNAILRVKKADWRGNPFKEREVRIAISDVLGEDALTDAIFELAKAQRDY